MTRILTTVLLLLSVSGCSSGDDKSGGPTPSGAEARMFGATCTGNGDCDSGTCFEFGNGAKLCTLTCGGPADCPSGSQGQKCNNKGYCAP